MKIKEIMELPEGTPIKVKKDVDCSEKYKMNSCRLSFYKKDRTGLVSYNPDTEELDIYFPFGVELIEGGVCYYFSADQIEKVEIKSY
jgi:hypothetical protein